MDYSFQRLTVHERDGLEVALTLHGVEQGQDICITQRLLIFHALDQLANQILGAGLGQVDDQFLDSTPALLQLVAQEDDVAEAIRLIVVFGCLADGGDVFIT